MLVTSARTAPTRTCRWSRIACFRVGGMLPRFLDLGLALQEPSSGVRHLAPVDPEHEDLLKVLCAEA